jgi:hypothetical protein
MWPYAKQQGHFIRGTLPVTPAFSKPLGSAPLLDDAAVSVPAPTGMAASVCVSAVGLVAVLGAVVVPVVVFSARVVGP